MTDTPLSDTPRRGPNVSMLKDDIDSGRTRDKVPLTDPGASPLGTNDEAGGTPPTPEEVALARREETKARFPNGKPSSSYVHWRGADGSLTGYIALIVLVAVIFLSLLWFL